MLATLDHVSPSEASPRSFAELMRGFGQHIRRVRTLCGLSQEEVAARAGVSQGVLSRLESGRNRATPFLVVLRVHTALAQILREADPEVLSDDLRQMLETEHHVWLGPVRTEAAVPNDEADRGLQELLALYQSLSDEPRQLILSLARAIARPQAKPRSH
ncbi:MAG TPA: helix-turn-helix transcriptional regulator [Candidatus Binatia bacterium]|nr:helix-turn-helix transcriptional regulator [Candidatus Binatia bacterium]